MKFCPICQKDFDDNKTDCTTCGQALLNGSYLENEVIFEFSSEELILKLFNCLCENGFSSVQYGHNAKTDMYYITASSDESDKMLQKTLLSLNDEEASLSLTQSERETVAAYITEIAADTLPDEGAKTYVNAKDRYENMMSSASSLIIVGLIGFVFVTLVYLKLINLQMNMLFYILSLLMFSVFIGIGIFSLLKANAIKKTISTEENLSEDIKNYLLTEYKPEDLEDNSSESAEGLTEEEKYFSRTEHMKKNILKHFEHADELLIDGMIEEVYNDLYPSEIETEEI